MNAEQKEGVLRKAREMHVNFVRLQFTDILGTVKNMAIPVERLAKALDGQLMFDGSSIEGFVRREESDMCLYPDPATFTIFPWKPKDRSTARLICDIHNPDGTPFAGCPRNALKRILTEAAELGFGFKVGAEPEFFLFRLDEAGKPSTITHDQAGYFDLSPLDQGEEARRDMVLNLREMGIPISSSHHEVAVGQHEIDIHYTEAITTADNIATYRFVVRTVAKSHGLHATFMPKPIFGYNGSGMHLHQSLFQGTQNAFWDPDEKSELSRVALSYVAGILLHARGFAAITNPLINSYKRLVPGYEAPIYIAWSERNRSPLVRIPAKRGAETRLELRSPDPAANPYLALAVTLKAGLDGIRRKLAPPPQVDWDISRMSAKDRAEHGIEQLPRSLGEAMDAFAKDQVVREALGEHIFRHFLEAKQIEWEVYRKQVHPWEVQQYLNIY